MLLKELFLREDDRSTAVFAFGRFNPPTIGHQKLIGTVLQMAEKANGKAYLFLSHKQNAKTDPLTFKDKQDYIQQFYPKLAVGDVGANTIIKALQKIQSEGRTKIIMVAGSDRVEEFKKLLNQYNGKPDKAGNDLYKFDSIDVVNAGQRDPDAEGVSGASASKARELAAKGAQQEFSKIAMGNDKNGTLYNKIRDALGIKIDENNKKLYNEDDMPTSKPIIYLDMDGVIADFFGGVEKMFGVNHWKELTSKLSGGELKQEVIDKITGSEFFATLPKFPTADGLIQLIKSATDGKFSILTSPLIGDHENSAAQKKIWISKNIEKPDEVIVSGRKEKWAKQKDGTRNILIDDRPVNIDRWKAKGGFGILYQANKDSIIKVQQELNRYGEENEASRDQ